MKRSDAAIVHEETRRIAESYVPEWHFTTQAPDVGSVVAILLDEMRADSLGRLDGVMHKHRIQYLNLFDSLVSEPVEAARAYVRFSPVASMDTPVHVPAGTQLLAEDDAGTSMVFETLHGITATNAQMTAVYTTDHDSDRIVCLRGEKAAEEKSFRAFDLSADNCARHMLLLGFERVFDAFDAERIGLCLETADPARTSQMAAALQSPQVRFSMLLPGGEDAAQTPEFVFPRPQCDEAGVLWLDCAGLAPETVELAGGQRYVLCIRALSVCDVQLSGIRLVFARQDVRPDTVVCGGVSQTQERFLPFGRPLELYAECGIESRAVYARRGARVRMEFSLSFEEVQQTLPEPVQDIDYKIIMKKQREAPRVEETQVHADYALLEYCSVHGWRRLIPEENAALLFNGSAQGKIAMEFTCPQDMVDDADIADGCRIRLRLLRADGLYRMPSRIFCPVVENLRFSYTYASCALVPDAAVAYNNFEERDVLAEWRTGRSLPLFYNHEHSRACMYLGFDANPQGSPLSLYFDVENNADRALDFTVEYGGPSGFEAVQAADGTEGLLYSGAMLVLVPADCTLRTLFGKQCWWLRLVSKGSLPDAPQLPLIRAVQLNMVRVENRRTRTEYFYVDDREAALQVNTAGQNLLHAAVFVNEDAPGGGRWVRWEKRTSAAQTGRVYSLDAASGAVLFAKGAFVNHPVSEEGAAVRVEYESYQGAQANVGPGEINTMANPVKYIGHVENPSAAFGGYDGYSEQTSAAVISNLLRTRERAVSRRDYFDIIAQACCGVRQIRCCVGVDSMGAQAPDTVTVALLIDEFEKGSHIFSTVRDKVRARLLETSGLVPMGKTLALCQPRFIPFSVRIWLECGAMDDVYELQHATQADIRAFLDPLTGGFGGEGWQIGSLPTQKQLLAYLKMKRRGLAVVRLVMVAHVDGEDVSVDDALPARVNNPFAMAVNGSHTVYTQIR